MFRWSTWFVGLVVAFSCIVSAQAGKIRVAALNLQWFPGGTPEATDEAMTNHIALAREAVKGLDPDIFIATEICDEIAFRNLVKDATRTELQVLSNFSDPEEDHRFRNQQIAISSIFDPIAAWAEPWKPIMEQHRRGYSFVAVRNPSTDRLVLIYGLHLKSNRSRSPEEEQQNYAIRDASIEQLIGHMSEMERFFADPGIDGWIIAGDFNTNHDGRFGDHVIKRLEDIGFHNTWGKTPPEKRETWKAYGNFSATTFDYIMVKGLGTPEAKLVVIDSSVSDHNAVVLEVAFPEKPAEKSSSETD